MKKLLTNSLIRAIIIVITVSLLLAGAIYAYETIWSGKANITIIGPAAMPELEVTGVTVDSDGNWNNVTKTWTASIGPGDSTHLTLYLKNKDNSSISYRPYIDGQEPSPIISYTPNIYIQTSGDLSLAAGQSGSITFRVSAYSNPQPGALPEIKLELRRY